MYLLDANIFIDAKNSAYGMDFCPAFWDWLLLKHSQGFLGSVDAVKNELLARQDELTPWASTAPSDFFQQPTSSVLGVLGQIANYIATKGYPPAEKNRFLSKADPFLIAHAKAGNHIVVTHEKAAPNSKKIKIPDVCSVFGVACCSIYDVIRASKARFVLESGTLSVVRLPLCGCP